MRRNGKKSKNVLDLRKEKDRKKHKRDLGLFSQEIVAKRSDHLFDKTPVRKQKMTDHEQTSEALKNLTPKRKVPRGNNSQVTPGKWEVKELKSPKG